MSLPKKDAPLQLHQWAHTILSARAKQAGTTLKGLLEGVLHAHAAQVAAETRYLHAQMEASGIEPNDWERYRTAPSFVESTFEAGDIRARP